VPPIFIIVDSWGNPQKVTPLFFMFAEKTWSVFHPPNKSLGVIFMTILPHPVFFWYIFLNSCSIDMILYNITITPLLTMEGRHRAYRFKNIAILQSWDHGFTLLSHVQGKVAISNYYFFCQIYSFRKKKKQIYRHPRFVTYIKRLSP